MRSKLGRSQLAHQYVKDCVMKPEHIKVIQTNMDRAHKLYKKLVFW